MDAYFRSTPGPTAPSNNTKANSGAQEAEPEPKCSWVGESQFAICAQDLPDPVFDIDDLLPQDGGPLLIFGAPGTLKSYSLMHLSECLASGRPFLGWKGVRRYDEVHYINLDAPKMPTKRRFKNIAAGNPGLPNLHLYNVEYDPAELGRFFAEHPRSIINIDCFADMYQTASFTDPAESMRIFLRDLRRLYENNHCNGVVVDHSNRGRDGASAGYYGSVQKLATVRSMWRFEVADDSREGIVEVKVTCEKPGEIEKFKPFIIQAVFTSAGVTFTNAGEPVQESLPQGEEADVRSLENAMVGVPSPGWDRTQIQDRMGWGETKTWKILKLSKRITSSGNGKARKYQLALLR